MTVTRNQSNHAVTLSPGMIDAVNEACGRIAPSWPLDRMIAVNPWWPLKQTSMPTVSAWLSALSGVQMLMPTSWYRTRWPHTIKPEHLAQAAQRLGSDAGESELIRYLSLRETPGCWQTVAEWLDSHTGTAHRMTWSDEIIHQISQCAARYFQNRDRRSGPPDATGTPTLYAEWLATIRYDRGLEIATGESGLNALFQELPDHPEGLIACATHELACDDNGMAHYFHALLLDIHGWASWAAYSRWQAALSDHTPNDDLRDLLAIRLAWELVLWRHCRQKGVCRERLSAYWQTQWSGLPSLIEAHHRTQQLHWVWQLAFELSYQESLVTQLTAPAPESTACPATVQAVFCIDVRSEPMRRALESQSPSVQTLGFAGFFGLPIAYQHAGSDWVEPRLPGLLRESLLAGHADHPLGGSSRAARALNTRARLKEFTHTPATAFSMVESVGIAYVWRLAKQTFFPKRPGLGSHRTMTGKGWLLTQDSEELTLQRQGELLAGILRAMGLTTSFAPEVLLIGHGSTTENNAQAAALQCGACGGHSGYLNAQILADLLNDEARRKELRRHGIAIPDGTRFIAACHDTTTETIQGARDTLSAQTREWLQNACRQARRNKAASLGITSTNDNTLARQLLRRAHDWSELRPEWGLANNAAFIAAPRARTRHLDLDGRCFLHDYNRHDDTHFQRLELIMTAPMIVAHWINMQYYASVTDNRKYGSGNKMLHNVVGGHMGVFEGNGGDLRTGLALQSLHDGKQWRHDPLRLSVFLDAPAHAVTAIYEKHPTVRDLVDCQWLHLFCWPDENGRVLQLIQGKWQPFMPPPKMQRTPAVSRASSGICFPVYSGLRENGQC
ncbi:MAG: YbcC family protein [Burkholderiaceae bacterium]